MISLLNVGSGKQNSTTLCALPLFQVDTHISPQHVSTPVGEKADEPMGYSRNTALLFHPQDQALFHVVM
jgi:hypothetical protein